MGLAGAIGGVVGGLLGKKSGGGTTTVQQSADPWIGAQPGLATLYQGAMNNYATGGPQYYPGQTYTPLSNDTLTGLNMMAATASNPSPSLGAGINQAAVTSNGGYLWSNPAIAGLQSASNYDVTGSQGWGDLMAIGRGLGDFQGMDDLNRFANGNYINTTTGLGQLMQLGQGEALGSTAGLDRLLSIGNGSMLGSTYGLSTLGGIAGGQNIGQTAGSDWLRSIGEGGMLNSNPYIDDMFAGAAENVGRQYSKSVLPGMASMFAGSGRYGSEAMSNMIDQGQRAYGDQMNNLASNIYGQNYAMERQLQQQALGQMQQTGLNERAQQLQALGLYGQLGQNEQQMMLSALGQAGSLSSQEQSRLLAALQSAGQLSQGERQMQLAGATNLGGLDAQNRGQRLSALQSGVQSQLQGQSLRNQALQSLSQQFMNERNNMMQSAAMAPALEQARYLGPQAMMNVGQFRDNYAQNALNSEIARWDFNQNRENNNLAFLSSIMSGASPYAQRSSQQNASGQSNPFMNMMGGAMMANAMSPMLSGLFASGPVGAGAAAGWMDMASPVGMFM